MPHAADPLPQGIAPPGAATPGAAPVGVTPVDEGLWTVEAAPIRAGGLLPLPLRMAVIRLADGALLLYSPTRFAPGLRRELEALGPIRHLVAPNVAHWMFLPDWQRACPEAVTWGAPGLRRRAQVRAAGLRIDHDLGPVAPAAWRDEVEQVLVRSGPFAEVAMFHRASRTLLVADLVLNVPGERMPPLARGFGGLAGILAPNGKAPIYLRALLKLNGRAVARATDRLVALAPRRVVMSHGQPFERDAAARLAASLSDLRGAGAGPSPATLAGIAGAALLIGLGLRRARRRGRGGYR